MHPNVVVAALVLLLVPGCTLSPGGEDSDSSDFSNAGVPPLPNVEDMPPMGSPGNQDTEEEFRCRFTSSRDYHQIKPNSTGPANDTTYDPADGEEQIPANSIPMKVGDHDIVRFEFEMANHGQYNSVWLEIADGLDAVSGDTRADEPFPQGKHTVILELQVEATEPGHLSMAGNFRWHDYEEGNFCSSLSYGVTE